MVDPRSLSMQERRQRALRFLERARLFRGLPHEMIGEAAAGLQEVRFPKGVPLYRQGHRLEQAFYTLLSGRVRLHARDEEGGDRILDFAGPGDVLGVVELLTGGPALASAEPVLDTVAMALPFRAFHEILAAHPAAALPLARLLGRRLRTWNSRPARCRTRVFLAVYGPEGGPRVSLTVLALARALIGITRSSVLVLDFAYGGPRSRGGGPGIVRALEEVMDARGWVQPELLGERVVRAADDLAFVQFQLPEGDLDRVPPEVLPALLGEAKRLAAYVLVNLPEALGPGGRKLLEQVEQVLVPVTPANLEERGVRAVIEGLAKLRPHVGLMLGEAEEPPPEAVLQAGLGQAPDFQLRFRDASVRSVMRLTAYPREALEDDEEAMDRARAVIRRLTKRRIGLCLGSGTALGWAHVGVLEVLERVRFPIDFLAASSFGSIVAGMYACGMTAAEMREVATSVDRAAVDALSDYNWPLMRDGLLRGDAVSDFLERLFGDRRLEDLEIPLVVQATDLARGEPVYLREGPMVRAIRASVSLPGIFRMVPWEGRYLVDGGVHDTLPTAPLREMGADRVLAVNTTQDPRLTADHIGDLASFNLFDVFLRSLEVMQTRRSSFEGRAADLVLQPRIQGISWRELWRGAELIEFGRQEAEENLDAILALLRRPPC